MSREKIRKADNQKPALNHVYMWTEHGWKHVKAEEVAKDHPGGTVSAHSGLFMCELCGQYVTLAHGPVRTPYFKHTREEESKNCPDRTLAGSSSNQQISQQPELPLRIVLEKDNSFHFEIGLVRVPENLLPKGLKLTLTPVSNDADLSSENRARIYNIERRNEKSISYFEVDEQPSESYTLTLSKNSDRLHKFWPSKIKGINPKGTLFDKDSKIMLPMDSDVVVGQSYYLLIQGTISPKKNLSIQIKKIKGKSLKKAAWNLYEISANRMSEEEAKFFFDLHYRLTDHPVSVQVLWPLFVKDGDLIKHNQDQIDLLIKGNIHSVSPFPKTKIRQYFSEQEIPTIYELNGLERQQFVTINRAEAIQSLYFWKEPLNQEGERPKLTVTDMKGKGIAAGTTHILPYRKILSFQSDYDGEIHLFKKGRLIEKRELKAGHILTLNNLTYGMSVQVFIGLDSIWHIEFSKQQSEVQKDEREVLNYVMSPHSRSIPIPHALRNMAGKFKQYPHLRQWIKQCISKGSIDLLSYRRLQELFLNQKMT